MGMGSFVSRVGKSAILSPDATLSTHTAMGLVSHNRQNLAIIEASGGQVESPFTKASDTASLSQYIVTDLPSSVSDNSKTAGIASNNSNQ